MSEQDLIAMRRVMVSNQLRPAGINGPWTLQAMDAVPRERFLAEGSASLAYRDSAVPLGGGRAMNPPTATGRMLDVSRPTARDHALVVGAATGYVPALLSELGCTVVALDDTAALLDHARAALADRDGVTIVEGPLEAGWPAGGPYDLIWIDGAVEMVPDTIVAQIKDGGRLIGAIVGPGIAQIVEGRRGPLGFSLTSVWEVDAARLPGFEKPKAFSF